MDVDKASRMAGNAQKIKDELAEQVRVRFKEFLETFVSTSAENTPGSNVLAIGKHSEPDATQSSRGYSQMTPNTTSAATPTGSGTGATTGSPTLYYLEQIKFMKNDDRTTLFVDYDHLFRQDVELAQALIENYYRFEPELKKGLTEVIRKHHPIYEIDAEKKHQDFWLSFYNLPATYNLRTLSTHHVGQLMCLSGTVTRTSEVRPELLFGSFSCGECGATISGFEQQFRYTEPKACVNQLCANRSGWRLILEQSKFADWQKIRVQENASEIPAGSMPRTIDVIVRNEIVDRAKAGDKCIFTGTLIVVPDITQITIAGEKVQTKKQDGVRSNAVYNEGTQGAKSQGARDLTYKLCFLASIVQSADGRFGSLSSMQDQNEDSAEMIIEQFEKHDLEDISRMKHSPQLYSRLVGSVAPSIFGHDEIKRGLLLMLFGGVHKKTSEGINLRGDINLCIVGDPSTAKSQFLKYVCNFLPRAVYTSGKASTAAGLTAAVVKDEETGQFSIEAGALMLADNGICCIDEFDKMDLSDQVAIHEAMEQQTISIAKAGIRATLNARASILAAANPIEGRYNKAKSLKHNINMSAPIMSRFDLFFIILDEQDDATDFNVARHILSLHQNMDEAVNSQFTSEQLQRYIRFARTLKPQLTPESCDLLVQQYRFLRQSDAGGRKSSYRITVRQLESMIRLSEALARLHCDDEVKPKYVREAFRLLKKSIIHVESEDVMLEEEESEAMEAENAMKNDLDVNKDEAVQDSLNIKHTETLKSKRKMATISYEAYHRIATSIVLHLRRHSQSNTEGLRKSEIMSWYLQLKEDEINSEEELMEQRKLIKTVLNRLVHKDNILLELRHNDVDEDPFIVVHSNYVIENVD